MNQNLLGTSLHVKYTDIKSSSVQTLTVRTFEPKTTAIEAEIHVAGKTADSSMKRSQKVIPAAKGATSPDLRKTVSARQQDVMSDSLAYAIKRAQVRCDEALSSYLDEGISPARFAALSTVGSNPGISQATLGGLLNIAGPSVVKVVDELQRLGLIKREGTSDRRVYALLLTDRGIKDLQRFNSLVKVFEQKIAIQLTPQERVQLLTLLAKVAPDEA